MDLYKILSNPFSKGHAVGPLDQLTSKLSSTRYLKKYLSDRYEILTEYSYRHGELLYSFGEWSGEKWISQIFQKHPFSSKFFVCQKGGLKLILEKKDKNKSFLFFWDEEN